MKLNGGIAEGKKLQPLPESYSYCHLIVATTFKGEELEKRLDPSPSPRSRRVWCGTPLNFNNTIATW